MRLFRQTLIFFILFMLIAAVGSIYVRKTVVLPGYFKTEAEGDRKEAERLLNAFNTKTQALLITTKDYAIWDQTFNFFASENIGDIKNDFSISSLNNIGVDIFAFVKMPEQKIIWQAQIDTEKGSLSDHAAPLPNAIRSLIEAIGKDQSTLARPYISGYWQTNTGLLMFAAVQVLPTNRKAESPGLLIFGKFVDNKLLNELSQITQVKFALSPPGAVASAFVPIEEQYRDENNNFYAMLNDWRNKPLQALVIKLDPRKFNDSLIGSAGIAGVLILLIFGGFGFWLLNNYLISPLMKITNHLSTVIDTSNYSLRLNDRRSNELGILARKTDDLLGYIEDQNRQLRQQAEMLRQISLRDPLTGIANRRAFDEHLSRDVAQAIRNNKPLALLFFDIDYFKDYNDHYGHSAGDKILIKVAQILSHYCQRASDLISRYGGEEFVLLLPDTSREQAEAIAEKILAAVSAANISHEYSPYKHLTLSIGISVMTDPSLEGADSLLDAADKALYRAKELGRNQLQIL